MINFYPIFSKSFSTSEDAILFCQNLAKSCGFSIRIRTSKLAAIYIVCSKEGIPDSKKDNFLKKRNRNSDRCKCNWKIVLFRNKSGQWEFRGGKNMFHNHPLFNEFQSTEEESSQRKPYSSPYSESARSCHKMKKNQITLPSLNSLDLPTLVKIPSHSSQISDASSSIYSRSEYSSESPSSQNNERSLNIRRLDNLPPLTNALPKIFNLTSPSPSSRVHNIHFITNYN
ncbi:hypothetical protein K502DRAFT_364814 [Neoconidiobolus thromboides FSU 785]|nr:hypothetical protein K502DRAFT_364814 [Neoconidiobolus thromboides FSU 785]